MGQLQICFLKGVDKVISHKIRQGLSKTINVVTRPSDAYITDKATIDYLLSTPALISMIIDGSCELLHQLIPDDYTTVGYNINLSHTNPTVIGEKVTIKITVSKVEGNRIFLDVIGHDSGGVICQGKYERVIVNKQKLMEKAYKRTSFM